MWLWGSAGHEKMTNMDKKDLISASVFQACCAATGHLGTESKQTRGKVDRGGGSVTDRNRRRDEGKKTEQCGKMEGIFYRSSASLLYSSEQKLLNAVTSETEKL